MRSRGQDTISLTGRSFGSERKARNGVYPSTSSLKVQVPQSILQRHETLTRIVESNRRRQLLANSIFAWKTSYSVEHFLQGKIEILFEELFYKWLNTRNRYRTIRRSKKAQNHYLFYTYRRVLTTLLHRQSQTRRDRMLQRRNSRLSSYYKHALKKRMFRSWKSSLHSGRVHINLQMEHQSRRLKIQNFMKSLQQPSTSSITQSSCSDNIRNHSVKSFGPHSPEHHVVTEACPEPRRFSPSPFASTVKNNSSRHSYDVLEKSSAGSTSTREQDESFDVGSELGEAPSFLSMSSNSSRKSINTSPLRSPDRRKVKTIDVDNDPFVEFSKIKRHTKSTSTKATKNSVDAANLRRDRLKLLQRETAERISKKRANEESEKRQKEMKEDWQLEQERKEYRNKILHKKHSTHHKTVGRGGRGGDEQSENALIKMQRQKSLKASKYYCRQLLIRCGISPWILLVQERRYDWRKACNFYSDGLVQNVWEAWVEYIRSLKRSQYIFERRQTKKATSHYHQMLLRGSWLRFTRCRRALRAKAQAVFSHVVKHGGKQYAFRAWSISLEKRRREITHSLVQHSKKSRRSILTYCFRQWQVYMQAAAMEKEIDNRVDMTWMKVQEWLT